MTKRISFRSKEHGSKSTDKKDGKKLIFDDLIQPITDTYRDDYDILNLHKQILSRLEIQREQEIKKLRREINGLKNRLGIISTETYNQRISKQIEKLEKELDNLESKEKINQYLESTQEFLSKYEKLGQLSKVISFKRNPTSKGEDEQKKILRLKVIHEYLVTAQNFIDLDITRIIDPYTACENCNTILTGDEEEECDICGHILESSMALPLFKESNRINISCRNEYEDRENFYKTLLRFKGQQMVKLPKDLHEKLDEYFRSYNLPTGEEIRRLPLNNRNQKDGTSRDLMFKALSDLRNLRYSDYYEDINLICHNYWGWPLPDISHLEDILMDDYDASQQIYKEIRTEHDWIKRTSCLNSQYRLYRHLKLRKYPCRMDDFKMIKTPRILEDYEAIWKIICTKMAQREEEMNIPSDQRIWVFTPLF